MDPTRLISQLDRTQCQYALYFKSQGSSPTFHTTAPRFKSASIIKIPILLAWAHLEAQGELSREALCNLDDEEQVEGAGFSWLLKGRLIPYHDVLLQMIATSDNLCTNLVIRHIGLERLQSLFETHFRLSHTRLERRLMDYAARQRGLDNWVGAEDGMRLFDLLNALTPAQRTWIDPMFLANQDSALLKRNILRDSLDFYHKTGSMGGVLHDWGYTADAAIFLFTNQVQDERALLPIFGEFGEWLIPHHTPPDAQP